MNNLIKKPTNWIEYKKTLNFTAKDEEYIKKEVIEIGKKVINRHLKAFSELAK
jgi:hypothetical protein